MNYADFCNAQEGFGGKNFASPFREKEAQNWRLAAWSILQEGALLLRPAPPSTNLV